ncbi:MAG: TRAP transporter substrate-binding protein [Thiothrix sp.]|nr:TRAP transporter substrate-binding protein [Thiothrix sp.]HPQ94083.1 TRAP transporter substrate-binding protein [Thiolinea sp.]
MFQLKKNLVAAVAMAICITSTIITSPAMAKDLKFSIFLPDGATVVQRALLPYAKKIEEVTNGELTVTPYTGSALGGGAEQLSLVETGVADIAFIVPSYSRGRFPVTELGLLPFAFNSGLQGGHVLRAMYDDYMQEEYEGLQMLLLGVTAPSAILTTNVALASLDAMKGVKLRGTGGSQNAVLEELGINLVSLPISEGYLAMERGVIQGTILPLSSAPGLKLEEIIKYVNEVNFSATPVLVAMNIDVWESLTPKQQEAIDALSAEYSDILSLAYDNDVDRGRTVLAEAGAKTVNFSAEDIATLHNMASPIWSEWIKAAKADGMDGETIMNRFRTLIKEQE